MILNAVVQDKKSMLLGFVLGGEVINGQRQIWFSNGGVLWKSLEEVEFMVVLTQPEYKQLMDAKQP